MPQAWRSLDLLRLKSGLDAGLSTASIELRFPLQVCTSPHAPLRPARGGGICVSVPSLRRRCSGCLHPQAVVQTSQVHAWTLGAPRPPPPLSLLPCLQEYTDEQTARDLRSHSLPAIVDAVRSFAVGGHRAPTCGVVEGEGRLPAAAGIGAAGLQGKGTSRLGKRAGGPAGRAAPAGGSSRALAAGGSRGDEGASFRGITKDNNGRQQCWIALVYASLE